MTKKPSQQLPNIKITEIFFILYGVLSIVHKNSTLAQLRELATMNIAQKSIVYVGGLEVNVTEEVLHAAFIPFGEIKTVQIPRDYQSSKCYASIFAFLCLRTLLKHI